MPEDGEPWVDVPTERGWYESIHYPLKQGYHPHFVRLDGRVFEYNPDETLTHEITSRLTTCGPFRKVKNIHEGDIDA